MAGQVGRARKRYNVPYPTLYAAESDNKDAKLFYCIQRGLQNSLELMPIYFMLMVLGGLKHPCASAGLGALYVFTCFYYFEGNATGDPQNRLKIGKIDFTYRKYGFLALLGIMICTISFGVNLVLV
ncbi:Microsomal glutathione S-transferase 3 [Quillaja saponaria]|uniref:Microsomal glutathione S-transferase 3 n=1 Tax=Quillaja saponaria TaxID=32244 RepID=A0AAD7LU77_QUISA|nr:Microsomal glutathione S-transferase 3 [Quillaja saponaria]